MLSFCYWLHWQLSFWQFPEKPMTKIPSKWHFRFSGIVKPHTLCLSPKYSQRTLHRTHEGEVWGVLCEFIAWAIFYTYQWDNMWYHVMINRVITRGSTTYTAWWWPWLHWLGWWFAAWWCQANTLNIVQLIVRKKLGNIFTMYFPLRDACNFNQKRLR